MSGKLSAFLGPEGNSRWVSMRQLASTTSLEELMAKLEADPGLLPTPEEVSPLVDLEFPEESVLPTPEDMDDALEKHDTINQLPFARNQWVERFGNDMLWHLEPVRRTVRVMQRETNAYKYFYKTSCGRMFPVDKVRAPQESIARAFGMRPFLWQQWAFYKIEEFVRFQKSHERDFRLVDFVESANLLWDSWLKNPKNAEFMALYNSKPETVRQKLKNHMFSPFELMNNVAHETKDWKMSKANISVYQYVSFFGSGWATALLVLFIQLVVPCLLLIYQVRESFRFPNYNNGLSTSYDMIALFGTDWDHFCHQAIPLDSIIMNLVIFIVYSVLPLVYDSFYVTVGDASSLNSRLNSMRINIWEQIDDTFFQQLGFKLDRYMNSVYIGWINSIMLLILFLTDNTVDVILNALAIDFLYNFDRDLPETIWYDPGFRYLKAGVVELLINGHILLHMVDSPDALCEAYGIDKTLYKEKVGGPLRNAAIARQDADNPIYMSAKDRIWYASGKLAEELERTEGIWQFREPVAFFGMGERILYRLFGITSGCIFKRFTDCYTWSLWDEALFLPPVPQPGTKSTFLGIPSVRHEAHLKSKSPKSIVGSIGSFVQKQYRTGDSPTAYWNYDPTSTWHTLPRFAFLIVKTLRFEVLWIGLRRAAKRGRPWLIPWKIVDGIFEWLAFCFLLFAFPIWLLFYLYLIIGCQPLRMVPGPGGDAA